MIRKPIHIAVIVSTPNEEYQSRILNGIRQYSSENNITLEMFTAFANIGNGNSHDIGEFNIFTLIDYSRFDGVILLINTIQSVSFMKKIIKRVKDSGIPAVCIDQQVEGLYSICIDNESAMRGIVEHFIVKHGFTRINYITGPDDNIDSQQRLKAYKQTMIDYGLPVEEERIYHGNFVASGGTDAIKYFFNSSLEQPQAIVCANDVMAVAAINMLHTIGMHIPQDICVSGFDHTENARNYSPSVTSVDRPLEEVGKLACTKIVGHMNGRKQELHTIMETKCVFSQSCGCNNSTGSDADEFRRNTYSVMESYSGGFSLVSRLNSALISCDQLDSFMENLKKFIPEFRCREFYLCLAESFDKDIQNFKSEDLDLSHIHDPEYHLPAAFSGLAIPVIAYRNGKFFDMEPFPMTDMLPGLFDGKNDIGNYWFVPLHFQEQTLGYIVIKDSSFPMSPHFHSCIMDISNSLDNVRKIICLDLITQRLNKLYAIDNLANINNRNGFRISTQYPYQKCVREKKPVMVMFLDLDGLKSINDNYGHKAGDTAIISVADSLRNSCRNGEICCRFGGDEFIVFAADYTEEKAKALKKHIEDELDAINKNLNAPYSIGASIGYHIAVPQETQNIFELVTVADSLMYIEKRRKKTSRYLKHRFEPDDEEG